MRSRRAIWWSAPAVLAGGMIFACCEEPERIVIGTAVSSGSHLALELAVEEVNAAGGIRGVQVELVGRHWQAGDDPEDVVQWAQRFAETENLVAVIGHSNSASTLSAAAVYNQYRIPQLVTIATHPAITNIGEWTYRLCISDARQGPLLARHAVGEWGKRRIAIIHVNDDYGRGLAERFAVEARRLGAEIVANLFHRNALQEDDRQLLRAQLAGLNELAPDLVVLIQRVEAADWTVRTIREIGLDVAILGADVLSRPIFLDRDTDLKQGMRVSQFFHPDLKHPRTRSFVRRFRELVGEDPDYGNAFGYDAIHLIFTAIEERGFSREAVKGYLDDLIAEGREIDGVTGTYRLGADHDAERPLYVVELRGHSFGMLAEVEWDDREG